MQNYKIKISYYLLFTIYYLLLLHGCAPVYKLPPHLVPEKAPSMSVRVLIGTESQVEIKGKALSIKAGNSEFKGEYFKANFQSIFVDNKELNNVQFPIEIISDDIITFENKRFNGSFVIYKKGTSFMLVNKVDIEDYLKGVVPHELRTDELEALKAQTVACRSYALSSIKPDADYDVTATVADQVYNGIVPKAFGISNRAIEETRGVVCTYEGKIIYAQYSSTCGGRTAVGGASYLKSRQCQFCEGAPNYEWECRYPKKEFFQKLGVQGDYIRIKQKNSSGRVNKLEIQSGEITGEDFRNKLGLKSRFFDINTRGQEIIIMGKGYGHGIGLCQYGAVGMARRGFNYKSILQYYYSDVRIEKIY